MRSEFPQNGVNVESGHQFGQDKNDGTELTVPSVDGRRVDENQPASAVNDTKAPEDVTPKERDIFDDLTTLARPLDEIIASEKLLTTLPVRKPKRDEWIRVHPTLNTPVYVYEAKDDRSWFVVLPEVVEPLHDVVRYVRMSLAVTYGGTPFIWPVPIPTERKPYAAHVSAFAAAELARKEWVRITWAGNDYEVYRRASAKVDPVWPTEISTASEMLRFTAKAGGFEIINSPDHAVVRRHLGLD